MVLWGFTCCCHDSCPSPVHFGHSAPVSCHFSIQPQMSLDFFSCPSHLTLQAQPVHHSQLPDLPHLPTHLFPFHASALLHICHLTRFVPCWVICFVPVSFHMCFPCIPPTCFLLPACHLARQFACKSVVIY